MSAGVHRFQKRASDLVQVELGRYWELNSGVLQEQNMLMTAEPSHQPLCYLSVYFVDSVTMWP